MFEICVVGTGYVGLTTGVCFANLGRKTLCLDIDQAKIMQLNSGVSPIYEEDLEEMLHQGLAKGNLAFAHKYQDIPETVKYFFMCLPTPQGANGEADLQFLLSAAEELADIMSDGSVIINKSTVPVGSAQKVAERIQEVNPYLDFEVVSNPEFLREGTAISDWLNPDRIVIGSRDVKTGKEIGELFNGIGEIVLTDVKSAEISKYAANAFLATKLSFINTISELCGNVNANIEDVTKIMGMDDRISEKFMKPGPGWGGSCFPKDVKALEKILFFHGANNSLIEATWDSNQSQFDRIANIIKKTTPKKIGLLGLTFKHGTDDMRDAPSLEIIKRLQEGGIEVVAYDHMIHPKDFSEAKAFVDPYHMVEGIDGLLVLTESPWHNDLDWAKISQNMKTDTVWDSRNIISEANSSHINLKRIGFDF